MKNWILTAAALFVFTTAATAAANAPDDDKRPDRTPMKGRMVENRTVKFDALPEAAQAFIRDFYAKDRVERIRFDPSAHLFAYKVRLDNDDEIMFSQNGAWTDIESADGIPMKLIPQQVADYVKNKYPGQTVTDIGLERNGISVRLADQTELLFDSDEHNLRQHMAGTRTKGSGDRHDAAPRQLAIAHRFLRMNPPDLCPQASAPSANRCRRSARFISAEIRNAVAHIRHPTP